MTEYRDARPGEREEFMDLARLSFGFDLEKLIPKAYGAAVEPRALHKVAVDERGRIRALVAVLPQSLWVAGRRLRVGYLGIVSTHPRDRERGHMKALMELWMEEGRRNFDMMALFGQRQRYERYGFTPGGIRVRHTLTGANAKHALAEHGTGGLSFSAFPDSPESRCRAKAINEARLSFVERNEDDIPGILSGFGQKAWAVSDRGRPLGYLATNAEGDEVGELGLEQAADLGRVLKGYLEFAQKPSIAVLVPEYERAINLPLSRIAERTVVEPADMYFIADFAAFLEAYLGLRQAAGGLAPGSFSAVLAGQPVTAVVGDSGFSVERRASPGAAELGRMEAQALLLSAFGKPEGLACPAGWFPLPVFWHYADRF